MHSPHPPRPPYPPRPGAHPGESDRQLLAQRAPRPSGAAGTRATAPLLARHWPAVHDYASICLASTEASVAMVTGAAFQRVLDRPGEGALRPQLLVTVRDMVKEWAADDSISGALPELRKPTGGRGLRVARAVTSERRRLAERAFRALPGASQCLLWHTEAEGEPISVPAGLLGVDEATAAIGLEQAREQFRSLLVRAHGELAPSSACRFHNRLLDVPIRRGGALLADVQEHLTECRYCRHAAEQLSHFDGALGVLLAETVLGWGAHRYLASRPARGGARPGAPVRPSRGGRHRPVPRRPRAKVLALGVGVVSLALLATVLTTRSWSDDRHAPGPDTTWGAPGGSPAPPAPPADGVPSAASADRPSVEVGRGRLRNPEAGLCLDAVGGRAVLAACSSAASQRWSYQDDGVLRGAADPTRCLVSDPDRGTVAVGDCGAPSGTVRYDLTVRGELLVRGSEGRAVAPGPDAFGDAVVTGRDGTAWQRWTLEVERGDAGAAEPDARSTETEGPPGAAPERGRGGGRPSPEADAPRAVPSPRARSGEQRYRERLVQVGDGGGARASRTLPADPAGDAVETVAGVVEPATATAAHALGTVAGVVKPLTVTVTDVAAGVGVPGVPPG